MSILSIIKIVFTIFLKIIYFDCKEKIINVSFLNFIQCKWIVTLFALVKENKIKYYEKNGEALYLLAKHLFLLYKYKKKIIWFAFSTDYAAFKITNYSYIRHLKYDNFAEIAFNWISVHFASYFSSCNFKRFLKTQKP